MSCWGGATSRVEGLLGLQMQQILLEREVGVSWTPAYLDTFIWLSLSGMTFDICSGSPTAVYKDL